MSTSVVVGDSTGVAAAPRAAVKAAATGRFRITSPRATMSKVAVYAVLAIVAAFFIAPLLWLLLASFEPNAAVGASVPLSLSFSNFGKILNWSDTFLPMINSAILSGGTAALTVVVSLFAAYPLSRYQMRFRKPFLYTLVFSTGLPITALLVPVYGMFARFNLVDNILTVIFFMTATSLPFGIWLMKGFMDGVPLDLEQAAWVDGANWLASLRRIVAPLMLPGIVVITIFTFVTQWGNFFVPFILLSSTNKLPASVSIYQFFSQYGSVEYGQLAAFSVLYALPPVALWVGLGQFLRGQFSFGGAVKG
ncbi:MAG TPA: carbohydrate ABC transporter permease [Acidimicrobiales bacterium]|nr:carbohydrate ABC transporter permease [Acidimicrobiales bacterium]